MITYAQNFEDVMLNRLFYGRTDGFYVDVGAHDPDFLSVTKAFYEYGWNGINIEPLKSKWDLFQIKRPRDINLNIAISNTLEKVLIANVSNDSALSSTNISRQSELNSEKYKVEYEEVECRRLTDVLNQLSIKQIDFLKIDVEGDEASVLASLDLIQFRPVVLVIESVRPITKFPGWDQFDPSQVDNSHLWMDQVLSNGYLEAYFDGLNKYFIRKEDSHLIKRMGIPPGVFDNIVRDLQENLYDMMAQKEQVIRNQQQMLVDKEKVIQEQAAFIRSNFTRPIFFILKPLKRFFQIIRPRLGNLNQYPARDLKVKYAELVAPANAPKISIVTPSYRQGLYIERTIQSVLDQAYPNLQYFIQDGGSLDGTVAVLKKYETQLAGWTSEKDTGQSQAINLGFQHTDGEIMAWLNSDDVLLPGALATVADYFNRHPDVDVVYGNRLMIDENDMEIGRWILPGHASDILSWADYVPQETLFWRRRIWDKAGGKIDESFRFAMDWDLLLRFRDAGAKFGHIPQFLGAFRIHEHQKTSNAINEIGHQEMNRIRERIMGRVPDRIEVRKAVLPYLVKHIAVDMAYRVKRRLGITA